MSDKQKILVLDDDNLRLHWFREEFSKYFDMTLCNTIEDAQKGVLENSPYDLFFLDHDLGEGRCLGNGVTFSEWLAKNYDGTAKVIIHSENSHGASVMYTHLYKKFKTRIFPYTELRNKWHWNQLNILGYRSS